MARARTQDGCGIAHASELLGRRWALLVVRELLLGVKRFTDLRTGVPGISPNVLGQRLRELEKAGDLEATYQLELGEIPFRIEVSDGSFEARRGEAEQPEATIRGHTDAVT